MAVARKTGGTGRKVSKRPASDVLSQADVISRLHERNRGEGVLHACSVADYSRLLAAEKITAVFTDLDETLWKGTIAEGQRPLLNKRYYDFLKSLHAKGVQLFVVSKNDEADVLRAFKALGIPEDLFTAVIANWDPKYLNIERVLRCTQLRPETVVFVDDNPLERSEVGSKLPEVHCVDARDWKALRENKYLARKKKQTAFEINERKNRYKTALLAESARSQTSDDEEFYRSLKRELSIGLVAADNLDRVTRLLVETHRINFNPGKFAVYDDALDYLHGRLNAGDCLYAVSARESGVSLGLTGALLVRRQGARAQITDGTFSCGIIGRDFEQKSILALVEKLRAQRVESLEVFVTLTSTNARVRKILGELDFSEERQGDCKAIYSLDLRGYSPANSFDWIEVSPSPPEFSYLGHPSVISFFERRVKPLFKRESKVLNVGSARGEVLGLLEEGARNAFYEFLSSRRIDYTKVDLQFYLEEGNIVADAEDLRGVISSNSQGVVMAVELLEHTEHFWKVLSEMVRACKVGGYIFISVPSNDFPKHEYPVDLWRIGPQTLSSFFPQPFFKTIALETEGKLGLPRRTIVLVQKLEHHEPTFGCPSNGKTDWRTGLTIFP